MSEATEVRRDNNGAQASSPDDSKQRVQHEPLKCIFLDGYWVSLRNTKACGIYSRYNMTNTYTDRHMFW